MSSVDNSSVPSDSADLVLGAVPIQVHNVCNPYVISIIYKTEEYWSKLNIINTKLVRFIRTYNHKTENEQSEPKLGDSVVVNNKLYYETDVPSSQSRGILGSFDKNTEKYNIFLIDYGISLQLHHEDFIVVPNDLIPNEPLSTTIGIYNILPIVMQKTQMSKKTAVMLENWTDLAIKFTKELINASTATYFSHITSDKCGKKYGDLYLTIDGEIILLSKTLVHNEHAIYVSEGLFERLKSESLSTKSYSKEVDNNLIFIRHIQNVYGNESDKGALSNSENTENLMKKSPKKYNGIAPHLFEKKPKFKTWEDINQVVLVYSSIKTECVMSVTEAKFPTEIHKAWDSTVHSSRPKRIQTYIWPAIMKGLNIVAIGPSNSGKTYGYAVAISGLLAQLENIPQGNKPSALVLCSSSSEVFSIHSLCKSFLVHYDNIKVVPAFNGIPERSLSADIYNGCQVLVTTPCFLQRLLSQTKNLLNFERLRYLIFDSIDIILNKYSEAVKELLVKHKLIANREKQSNGIPLLQMIMSGKTWTPQLKKFIRVMEKPYVCIGSFIEAFIFKGMILNMIVIGEKHKSKKLLDLLGDKYTHLKTMIVCTDAKEAEELSAYISQYKSTYLAHENMNFIAFKSLKECWRACVVGFYPILICTDDVLPDLSITDIDWLIHYSVSLAVKSQFNFRFSVLVNNLKQDKPNCKVTVFVDENNDLQFQSIVRLMQRTASDLPKEISENAERILYALDREKEKFPLCDNVKALGFCPNRNSCIYRHCVLPEVDTPLTRIKIGDRIKFNVMQLHDAGHFTARIVEYISADSSEKVAVNNNNHVKIFAEVQKFFGNVENRKRKAVVNVGDICAFEKPVNHFQRVKVLCMKTKTRSFLGDIEIADVRSLDDGIIFPRVDVNKLLSLPDEFSEVPNHIVELFLTDVAPYDDEYIWNHRANDAVSDWFKNNLHENCYVSGVVRLHLGDTIWVDTLDIVIQIIGYPDLVGSSLKEELVINNHAVESKEHILKLYNLCRKGGLVEVNGRDIKTLSNGFLTDSSFI